jgi:LmbE family N-acetylglucosaminyl deacetylase
MVVLVIATHPDDEVLGVGGTIARLVDEGKQVTVTIVTRGDSLMFDEKLVEQGREEAREAHRLLGVKETLFLDKFPAAKLDQVPHHELNRALQELIQTMQPSVLFIPFVGDIHLDHQLVFKSALVAVRPQGQFTPHTVLAYETLSETNWNAPYLSPGFCPDLYVDISEYIEQKLKAIKMFRSQLHPFPNERSVEAIQALATHRGATVGCHAAEAFVLIRKIHNAGLPLDL